MKVIILAAGKGSRMGGDIAKAITPINGKPMIQYLLDTIIESKIDTKPIVVIGYKSEQVKQALKNYNIQFVKQEKQNGTGHAVLICKNEIDQNQDILVLYADHPLVSAKTLKKLIEKHNNLSEKPVISMLTYVLKELNQYDNFFSSFGRIIRDEQNHIQAIKEIKDASESEKKILEINPAYYLFSGNWIWKNINNLSNNNQQNEFYLTDLIALAVNQKLFVQPIKGNDLKEALGVNTPEQLLFAEQFIH